MKSRTLSRFLAAALVAGSAFVAAPAVYAADAPAAKADSTNDQSVYHDAA